MFAPTLGLKLYMKVILLFEGLGVRGETSGGRSSTIRRLTEEVSLVVVDRYCMSDTFCLYPREHVCVSGNGVPRGM